MAEAQARWRLLLDAVGTLGSDRSLDDVLRRLVGIAADLAGARYAALGVLDLDGRQRLRTFITHGIDDQQAARIGHLPRGHGVLGVLIDDPVPVRLHDIAVHPSSYGFPAHHPPMHSFLGVPVRTSEGVFGNLYLAEKIEATDFTDEDEEIVTALASAAGVAIENVHAREERERTLVLADRERIGRDLHDLVIQRLFAIGLSLESGIRRADDRTRQLLNDGVEQVDETIREIRRTIFELHGDGDAGDAQSQVTALVERAAQTMKLRPALRFEGPVRLRIGPALTKDLLAVLGEALTNVHRHADATEVEVTVAVGEELLLRVRDNGRGPAEVAGAARGAESGVANMRQRAEARGGRCVLAPAAAGESGGPGGTVVEWRVPLPTVPEPS